MKQEISLPGGRQGSKNQEDERDKGSIVVEKEEVSVDSLRREVGAINKKKALYGDSVVSTPLKAPAVVVEAGINLMDVPVDGTMTKEWLSALWRGIIGEMKQYNHTIAGVLRSCQIANYDAKKLVIETAYQFHKEKLDEGKTRTTLIQVCKVLTGKDVEVTIELKK